MAQATPAVSVAFHTSTPQNACCLVANEDELRQKRQLQLAQAAIVAAALSTSPPGRPSSSERS